MEKFKIERNADMEKQTQTEDKALKASYRYYITKIINEIEDVQMLCSIFSYTKTKADFQCKIKKAVF